MVLTQGILLVAQRFQRKRDVKYDPKVNETEVRNSLVKDWETFVDECYKILLENPENSRIEKAFCDLKEIKKDCILNLNNDHKLSTVTRCAVETKEAFQRCQPSLETANLQRIGFSKTFLSFRLRSIYGYCPSNSE